MSVEETDSSLSTWQRPDADLEGASRMELPALRWGSLRWRGAPGTVRARREVMNQPRALPFLAILGALVESASMASGQCALAWSGDSGVPGTNGSVTALRAFDDGSGPKLYASG